MRCFFKAMREYALFGGRSGRREFWSFFAGFAFFGLLAVWLDRATDSYNFRTGVAVFTSFWFFGFLLPWMAACTRRLHDSGRSGFWLLPGLAALIYLYVFSMPVAQAPVKPFWPLAALCGAVWAVLMLLPGDDGPNAFGAPEQPWC